MNGEPSDAPDALDAELQWAVEDLRIAPEAGAAWRASLDEALRDEVPPVARRVSRTGLPALLQLAAALTCVVIGALGATIVGDARGTSNSLASASTPETASDVGVRFAIVAPGVKRVSLVGDFNRWDAGAAPLQLARDGVTWTTTMPLSAGRHTYAFVIDGQVVADPAAPSAPENDFGVPNSILLVSSIK